MCVVIVEPKLSDYDKYQASKYFPGEYKNRCTYSPSGQMTASVCTRNGYSLAGANLINATVSHPLGSVDTAAPPNNMTHLVLMY